MKLMKKIIIDFLITYLPTSLTNTIIIKKRVIIYRFLFIYLLTFVRPRRVKKNPVNIRRFEKKAISFFFFFYTSF